MAGQSTQISVKLTGAMRDDIVRRAIGAAFDKEKAALDKRESAIARHCYNLVFSAAMRRKAKALPNGWCNVTVRPSFSVAGMHMEFRSEEELRVPYSGGYRLGTITDKATVALIEKLQDDKRDYQDRRKRAEAATEALVGSCTTTKRLREIWPQGLAFYKHVEPTVAPQLPAAQIQELNAMLGLKKAA